MAAGGGAPIAPPGAGIAGRLVLATGGAERAETSGRMGDRGGMVLGRETRTAIAGRGGGGSIGNSGTAATAGCTGAETALSAAVSAPRPVVASRPSVFGTADASYSSMLSYTLPDAISARFLPLYRCGIQRRQGKSCMTFTQRLNDNAAAVEARLAALVVGDGAEGVPQRLGQAMRHAVLAGGKRIRPFLVIETAALFGVSRAAALDTAAALECVHCYSLVHDDLPSMDNDTLRRGRPTVWAAYDEWTAILAGDALLTLAFDVLSRTTADPDPAVRSALVLAVARAAGGGGMVGGQVMDLEADKLGVPPSPDLAHIRALQAKKTGALLRVACEVGAILGRAGAAERAALVSFGEALGLAFQIADDLLDAEGDAATVGKAVGKDAAAGKATLVSLLGADAARQRLAEVEAEAIACLAPFGPRAATLVETARFVARRTH